MPIRLKLLFQASILGLFCFNTSIGFGGIPTKKKKVHISDHGPKHAKNNFAQVKTIVIDAGHGGKDSGCLTGGLKEKDITLAISKQVYAMLRATLSDVQIIMTRDDDRFLPLQIRADIANNNHADIFISIHCNALKSKRINGSESYVMGLHKADQNLEVVKRENASLLLEGKNPNDIEGLIMMQISQNAHLEQSLNLADKIEKYLGFNTQLRSRGVKQAGFYVLKATAMPSVLVETGYLTNKKDFGFLKDGKGQQEVAAAIHDAVIEYCEEYQKNNSLITVSTTDIATNPSIKPKEEKIRKVRLDSDPTDPKKTNKPKRKEKKTNTSNTDELASNGMNAMLRGNEPTAIVETKSTGPKHATKHSSDNSNIEIQIQLGAFGKKKSLTDPVWKGTANISEFWENGLYKYRVTQIPTIAEAKLQQEGLKAKGFSNCYLIVLKNGERIPTKLAESQYR